MYFECISTHVPPISSTLAAEPFHFNYLNTVFFVLALGLHSLNPNTASHRDEHKQMHTILFQITYIYRVLELTDRLSLDLI